MTTKKIYKRLSVQDLDKCVQDLDVPFIFF
jgi:hypothetical protein